MEISSNYLREHQIVKFNREASNATKNTKLARVKPARDRDRVGCFIPHHQFVMKTILQGIVKGARRRGRQKKRWEDNIKEWTGMGFGDSLRAADREEWKGIVATSSVVPR